MGFPVAVYCGHVPLQTLINSVVCAATSPFIVAFIVTRVLQYRVPAPLLHPAFGVNVSVALPCIDDGWLDQFGGEDVGVQYPPVYEHV